MILIRGFFVEHGRNTELLDGLGYSVLGRSPWHAKYVKDLSLISALHQSTFCDFLATFASYDVFVEASLIKPVPLCAS